MRILVALVLVTAAVGPVAGPTEAAGPEVKTEEQKVMYALGLAISNSLANFRLSETELELVKAGIADGVLGKERKVDLQTYGPKLQELQKTRLAAAAEGEKKAGQAVLVKAAAEKGAVKTASGMIVERRDQVLITFFFAEALVVSIFFCRWPSMNGPFFRLRIYQLPFALRDLTIMPSVRLLLRVLRPLASWPHGEQG